MTARVSGPALAAEAPAGAMTWALHFSLAPTLFEPAETPGLSTPLQQLIHDKAVVLPIWRLALLQGGGPRVAESGLGHIADHPWSAPYEDLALKPR